MPYGCGMAADPWEIDWLDLRTKSVEPVDGESVLVVHAPDILRYSPNLVKEVFCELRLLGILRSSLPEIATWHSQTGTGYAAPQTGRIGSDGAQRLSVASSSSLASLCGLRIA